MDGDASAGTAPLVLTTKARSFIGLVLLNTLLNILTLTLYRFWGRTAIRRRLWAETQLAGESFEYTGKGSELFKGFLLAAIVVFLPIVLIGGVAQAFLPPGEAALAMLPIYLLVGFLAMAAIFLVRRYQLSRTLWRGIRFGLAGSPWAYAAHASVQVVLIVVTLGWWLPAAQQRLAQELWAQTRYGDEYFQFGEGVEGRLAGPTYRRFAIGWFIAVFGWIGAGAAVAPFIAARSGGESDPAQLYLLIGALFGGILLWLVVAQFAFLAYQAAAMRRTAELVSFGETRFRLKARTLGLLWLAISNGLIVIVSLGFLYPLTQIRAWRYVVGRLEAVGPLSLATVAQSAERGPRSGEGLADGLDFGGV